MDIHELADAINTQSSSYNFGSLQDIRKEIKNLNRKPSNNIFTAETISDDGWAFHRGGRSEIQFNIGFEDDGLRYGLAFSLEPSRAFPDVRILFPKILRLNSIYRESPELFTNYKLWYWSGERSETLSMQEIPTEWIQSHSFIFFGKLMDENNINIDEIISTFDAMLPIYIEVESNVDIASKNTEVNASNQQFVFDANEKSLPVNRNYTSIERQTNIDIRHSIIQEALFENLVSQYGIENVSKENPFMGNKIDLVVRLDNDYIFYEVKTGNSAKSCIRQAMGQLLEYSYFPGICNAKEIIVAGEHTIDIPTSNYIEYLRSEFKLPINYVQVVINE
jgi:hypothetical protein